MAEQSSNIVIGMPSQLFTRPDRFASVANGMIYIGIPDTDPTVSGNQQQVYIENEDGSLTAVPQPIRTNLGGYPVYNGQIVKFVTQKNYSMSVLSSLGVQLFYFPDLLKYDPDQLKTLLEIVGGGATVFDYNYPRLPNSYSANIGDIDPNFMLEGTGSLTAYGITFKPDDLAYNPSKENVLYTPGTYLRQKTGEAYPTRENPLHIGQCYRFVLSQGSLLDDDTKAIDHVVAVGNTIGCAPLEWTLVDAFGGNAMIYAGRVSRTTAIGSESMAWFGAPNQQWMIDKCHDFWRKPASNPYLPGDPNWNAADLETNFPGIGARLAAFTGYATTSDQAGYSAGLGRDALNHIVVGVRNTAAGYASAQHMFNGSYNTAIGALALNSCVFGEANTAVGDQAGRLANDSLNCTFLGYAAGRSIRGAVGSVFIGDRTADNVLTGTKAVVIGAQAGQDHPTTLDNKLIISTSASTGTQPLISGDFSKTFAGVNISPDNVRAHWHVRDGNSSSTLTVLPGILVEGASNANVTIESNNTGFARINFADNNSINSGVIEYSHASDSLTINTGGAARARFELTGSFIPMVDNAYLLGRAAFRWSTVYAGTGTINTSDAREKTEVRKLTSDEISIGLKLADEIGSYQWLQRVQDKGADARRHFGMTVQRAIEIFEEHGIDPFEYGAICYDKWEESTEITPEIVGDNGDVVSEEKTIVNPAGDRYSFRPDELTYLICGAVRANQKAIEDRLSALESK